MEIERKYLTDVLPENLEQYEALQIEQGYLCETPVVRIRRMNEDYILTYKSKKDSSEAQPVCVNQEVELPLTAEAYAHLKEKIDGHLIEKTRYRIPYGSYVIELDVFHGTYDGMVIAEVEFPSVSEAEVFEPPDWFGRNVSDDYHYSNAWLATGK